MSDAVAKRSEERPPPAGEPAIAGPLPEAVVVFDGVCNLCNGWVRFVARRDPAARFHFASVQSEAGQRLLARCGLPLDRFDTLVFVDRGQCYVKSAAFLHIVAHLAWPWPLLRATAVVPRGLRDWVYDRIARNRYRLFGRQDSCPLPSPDLAKRFL